MHTELAAIDVAIVVLYVLGTIGLGAWFTRRQHSLRTYFVGDRNVSWWLVLISIVATETSTVTFLSVPGVAFNRNGGNLTFLQLAFGYVVGRILIAWFLLPQYLRGELYSAYQLLRQRFNSAVQRTASGLFLATRVVADGLRLYLAGLLLQQFTGWDGQLSIVVIGVVTMIYTYLGGMEAVIWTDLIQFVIYIAGAIVAAFCIVGQIPGSVHGFIANAERAGKLQLLNLSTDWSVPYTLWAGVIGGAFFTMASHGADQMMVQRYFCSKSLGQARTALVLSGFVVLLQFLLFLLIGVGLFLLWQDGALTVGEQSRNDEVFGQFIVHFLPHGIVGLVIAAVLAAAMSTLASSLNSSAGAFVADFYRPLRSGHSEEHYLTVSRVMTTVWGVSRIAVAVAALYILSERSVVDQVLKVAGFTTGMILGVFLLGSLRRAVSSAAALAGLIAGFAAVLGIWLSSLWTREWLAWPWYAPVGTVVTVAIGLLVNRLRKQDGPPSNGSAEPGVAKAR
jgi:SSS family solute:Na+ symporter